MLERLSRKSAAGRGLAHGNKFGLSWQISPIVLGEMLADKDKAKATRVMKAMMEMDKIDISQLERAAKG